MFGLKQHKTGIEKKTLQHSTVQYSTVQYSTVQYSTVKYSSVKYSTVLTVLYTLNTHAALSTHTYTALQRCAE